MRWPRPVIDPVPEPHLLFIVTPPFSGSTALASLLHSSPRTLKLQEQGEGQWLVPGLCEVDRWDAEKTVDYESVRAVWLQAWQRGRQARPLAEVVIEKSPPNMVRLQALLNLFPRHSLLAINRDPYANCASILYRNFDAARLIADRRREILVALARDWMRRSRLIRAHVLERSAPLLTYEQFCADPRRVLGLLQLPSETVEGVDPQALVQVKDYPLQPIVDQNPRQVALLSEREQSEIGRVLGEDPSLLEFFSYPIAGLRCT